MPMPDIKTLDVPGREEIEREHAGPFTNGAFAWRDDQNGIHGDGSRRDLHGRSPAGRDAHPTARRFRDRHRLDHGRPLPLIATNSCLPGNP